MSKPTTNEVSINMGEQTMFIIILEGDHKLGLMHKALEEMYKHLGYDISEDEISIKIKRV